MDFQNLSPAKMDMAFKLCDILNLQDFYVAATILDSYNWDLQKAVDEIAYSNQPNISKPINNNVPAPVIPPQNQEDDPYNYNVQDDEQQVNYQDYQYQYPVQQTTLQNKKKMFEQEYVTVIPLQKTISQPNQLLKGLSKDRVLAEDYCRYRHQYQNTLLKKSEILCQKIFESMPQKMKIYKENQRKIQNNKKFLVYLNKNFKTRINFTFGTFYLNLARSHLDFKYLFVYIHCADYDKSNSNVVERILAQPEFANFINNNCISYGMFDNSDDYQILQKYVPIKALPAFALFKFNKKDRSQQFVSSYTISQKQDQNCLQWVAKSIGVTLKKKQQKVEPVPLISNKSIQTYEKMSDILKDQNMEYFQMEKLYKLKRAESKLNKQKIKQKLNQIEAMKKQFATEKQFFEGKNIQIKFRMPSTGQSRLRVFQFTDKIQKMFDYVESMCSDQFQQMFSEFDLTQTFPFLSLKDKINQEIGTIFEGSSHENIIVKQQ